MADELKSLLVKEMERSPDQSIPFVRYMELVLYHPQWGYYNQVRPKLGRTGDFFTNAHVGQVYGRVLSRFFRKLGKLFPSKKGWAIVEMGAGDGRLAEQVIHGWLESGEDLDSLHFYLVETSPYHRQIQQERLNHLPVSIKWISCLSEIPAYDFSIVYSNELVDSFPVHRIKKERGQLFESYVTLDRFTGLFKESWGPLTTPQIQDILMQLEMNLDDGQTAEVNRAARRWLQEVSAWMNRGFLLTIDYGGETSDLLQRWDGTLRGYHAHQLSTDLLLNPGMMDLTSHVNFSALQGWGEEVGLQKVSFQTQSRFLLEAGILDFFPPGPVSDPFSPAAKQSRAIRQLIHPQAMGEVFHVLLQAKEVSLDPRISF